METTFSTLPDVSPFVHNSCLERLKKVTRRVVIVVS